MKELILMFKKTKQKTNSLKQTKVQAWIDLPLRFLILIKKKKKLVVCLWEFLFCFVFCFGCCSSSFCLLGFFFFFFFFFAVFLFLFFFVVVVVFFLFFFWGGGFGVVAFWGVSIFSHDVLNVLDRSCVHLKY